PEAPQPARAPRVPPGRFGRELAAVSSLVGVPVPLLQGVMQQESTGHPGAVSNGGYAGTPAYGLMQIVPGTFRTVAPQASQLLGRPADLANPFDNILASGLLWRKYLDRSNGDIALAAKMYHGGESGRLWGPVTEQYSRDVVRRYAEAGG